MATAGSVCSSCQSTDCIGVEEHGGHQQTVCYECGAVLDQDNFQSNYEEGSQWAHSDGQFHSYNMSKTIQQLNSTKKSVGLTTGISLINTTCSQLSLSDDCKKEAQLLYEKVIKDKSYKQLSIENKKCVAVCCIYATCRMRNLPVTIHYLLQKTGCESKFFCKHLLIMKKMHGIEFTTIFVEDAIVFYCDRLDLSKDESDMIFKLVSLLKNLSVVHESEHNETIIIPCAYLVWQTGNLEERRKEALSAYCKRNGLAAGPAAAKKLIMIKTALCKLVEELPWSSGTTVKPKNVVNCIPEILKHRTQLTLAAKASCSTVDVTDAGRKRPRSPNIDGDEENVDCGKRSKIYHDLDNTELTNDDISEKDLKHFIRTEEEVEAYTNITSLFSK